LYTPCVLGLCPFVLLVYITLLIKKEKKKKHRLFIEKKKKINITIESVKNPKDPMKKMGYLLPSIGTQF
jgi:hypothetical protein